MCEINNEEVKPQPSLRGNPSVTYESLFGGCAYFKDCESPEAKAFLKKAALREKIYGALFVIVGTLTASISLLCLIFGNQKINL